MRAAYGGRAAAYGRKNDYEKALRDRSMVLLLLGVELEILNEQSVADRDKIMTEASEAYRNRSACFKALGRLDAAQTDAKHAERLEQEARKLEEARENGQIELINRWPDAISIVIDGVAHRLAIAESKVIAKKAGPFRYELPASGQISTGTVEAGKTFRLQIIGR
jgi:hypothetical protein